MSCNCNTNCNCASANSAATIAELQTTVDALSTAVQVFVGGNPIVMLRNASGIAMFDANGKGSGPYTDWAFCNGNTFINSSGVSYTTVNLYDKFIVVAGASYVVGDTGGLDSVSLTGLQNGTHSHGITDAGHTHPLVDPGHLHGITDPSHSHAGSSTPHTHTLTIDNESAHVHGNIPNIQAGLAQGLIPDAHLVWTSGDFTTSGAGTPHTHTGTADPATVSVTTNPSPTGISVQSAFTGATVDSNTTGITVNNSGLGDAHENRPPFFALVFIERI